MTFNVNTFDVNLYDKILERELSTGLGIRGSPICIEAAICQVLGLDHGDNPRCVTASVKAFKICLNNKDWVSERSRASGLRDLGLAQLGSLDVINDSIFTKRLTEEIIGQLIPELFYEVFPNDVKLLQLADNCRILKNQDAAAGAGDAAAGAADDVADAAAGAAYAAWAAADAASYAAYAAAGAAYAIAAASYAAYAAAVSNNAAYALSTSKATTIVKSDKYLKLVAKIALDILIELKSPGCALLEKK